MNSSDQTATGLPGRIPRRIAAVASDGCCGRYGERRFGYERCRDCPRAPSSRARAPRMGAENRIDMLVGRVLAHEPFEMSRRLFVADAEDAPTGMIHLAEIKPADCGWIIAGVRRMTVAGLRSALRCGDASLPLRRIGRTGANRMQAGRA